MCEILDDISSALVQFDSQFSFILSWGSFSFGLLKVFTDLTYRYLGGILDKNKEIVIFVLLMVLMNLLFPSRQVDCMLQKSLVLIAYYEVYLLRNPTLTIH